MLVERVLSSSGCHSLFNESGKGLGKVHHLALCGP